jgi:signal transduction histidine kinase/CheY-like chemotaxis protein
MLKGETGTASYDYGIVRGSRNADVHKHAYFMPIPLESTYWSICVSASEEEALLFIKGFRDRWIMGMTFLLVSFGVWGVYLARAFLAVQRERTGRIAEARVRLAERAQEEEKNRLEEKLRQSQKLEAVGQLAGGVAHDFNNLLTVQLGHLDLLNQIEGLPAEVRESHAEIAQSAIMASQLTRHLLAFSRQQVLQIRRLDLNEVLDHLIKMLRRLLREDIGLELKMARTPLWLDADESMLEQVLMNLVVNARDAMPSGGRLTLSTEIVELSEASPSAHPEARPGRFVCLVVADTGHGMNAQTRERIFEPFFTTKGPGKGTGLGLATVYGIVKQHHGWIEVESAENQGSVFRVCYPAATAPEPVGAEVLADPISNLRGAGETVLLVEDNPFVSKTLAASLSRLNYQVLSAAHSQEALHLWQEHRGQIQILLTDMVMPNGVNGLELAMQLRAERPELPVIVVSGYSQELVAGGLSAGMLFLPKPCSLVSLANTLRQSLNPQPAPPGGS